MNFLNIDGLNYFYTKLKEKFVASINSQTPDSNGNVIITNVATADNLTSPDGQSQNSTFTYRTSGGSANIASGEAKLIYIDGNIDIKNRQIENLDIDTDHGIQVSCDLSDWREIITDSGNYTFRYVKPTSDNGTSQIWQPEIGKWYRYTSGSSTIVNLENYGISVSGIEAPVINISWTFSNSQSASYIPSVFMENIDESGIYEFKYNQSEGGWLLLNDLILLSSYGITINGNGILSDGDTITITYTSGTPTTDVTFKYTAPKQGTIVVAKPTAFQATGFNQFDKNSMYIQQHAGINVNGKIVTGGNSYIAYCRAKGGVDNGYVAYSASGAIEQIGWCEELPIIDSSVTINTNDSVTAISYDATISSIVFKDDGYVVVQVSSTDDLCMHPKWSGSADTQYEDYVEPSTITFPLTSTTGTALPLQDYGMPKIGNVADRLNLDVGVYIKNIGRVDYSVSNLAEIQTYNVDYDYDEHSIYYVLSTPVVYPVNIDSTYIVNDFGTEEFIDTNVDVFALMIYGQNLRDKLRIGVVEKGGDTMTGNLNIQSSEPYINVKNSEISPTTTVDKSCVIGGYTNYYNNGDFSGYLVWRLNTDGSVETDLRSRKIISNKKYDNQLRLAVNADGSNSVIVTDPAAWRTALNVVNKSGDTMNGSLIINNTKPYINFISTGNKIGKKPTGNMYSALAFYATDTTQNVGLIGQRQTATQAQQLYMYAMNPEKTANGTQNALTIGVSADGTRTVQVSDPAVWRETLGIRAFQISSNASSTIAFQGNGCFVFGARGDTSFVAAIDYWSNSVNVLPIGSGGAGVTITKAANAHTFTIRNTRSSLAIVGAIIPAGLVVPTTPTT